jgi:predicted transcriptional regulator
MSRKLKPEMHSIESLADIPAFENEQDEALYWSTHTLSEKLLANMQPLNEEAAPRPRKTHAISLRIDEGLLARLQALADTSHRPYQSLLKQFLLERVELEESKLQAATAAARQNELLTSLLGKGLNDGEIPVITQFAHLPDAQAASRFRLITIFQNCGVDPTDAIQRLAERVDDLAEDVAHLSESRQMTDSSRHTPHAGTSEVG